MKNIGLICLIFLGVTQFSRACDCSDFPESILDCYISSGLSIHGLILSEKLVERTDSTWHVSNGDSTLAITIDPNAYYEYLIEVKQDFNTEGNATVIVRSEAYSTCMQTFTVGKEYFVFAAKEEDCTFKTDQCYWSTDWNQQDHDILVQALKSN